MMSASNHTVAVLGMGRMGSAMAARIAGGGYPVVVWNRDRAKAEAAAGEIGADVATTPADAAARAGTVLTSLADDAAVEAVYLGPDGIAAGIAAGAIAIDTSTVDPDTSLQVGAAIDDTGAGFLDCPVSGSVSTVQAGTLTVMIGGEPSLAARAEPVLATFAGTQFHVGGRGAGATCKLAVNGLVHAIDIGLSEALVLAEKAGVDREIAYDVFAAGAGGAPFVTYKRAAFVDPDGTPVAFSIELMAKDLRLITTLGERVGAPMAQATTGLSIVDDARAAGLGERDMSAIASYLREAH